jgi:hypothetical protein
MVQPLDGGVIRNWSDLAGLADRFGQADPYVSPLVFRGQATGLDEWPLISAFGRMAPAGLPLKAVTEIEDVSIRAFQQVAVNHLPAAFAQMDLGDVPGWTAIMQHYGAPTRLLDWSKSIYVAAYHAVNSLSKDDGFIFYADLERLWVGRPEQLRIDDNYSAWRSDPNSSIDRLSLRKETERITAQQGVFTLTGDPRADHWQVMAGLVANHTFPGLPPMGFFRIPAKLKSEILRNLVIANVHAYALYPGLDGVGKATDERLKLLFSRLG